MTNLFLITPEDIGKLDAKALVQLLNLLLQLESDKYKIPKSGTQVASNILCPDGGEDGRIAWAGEPARTEWIPHRLTLFQCKATEMSTADCKKELLQKGKIKSQVEEVFNAQGQYIVFCSKNYTKKQKATRIKGIRDTLTEAKFKDAKKAKIDFYSAEDIANWVNSYLVAILFVAELIRKIVPSSCCTWHEWSRNAEMREVEYVPSPTLTAQLAEVRAAFRHPYDIPQQEVRITGLSGVGKSRLALEVFRPQEQNPAEIALHRHVGYIDAGNISKEEVLTAVRHMRRQGLVAIIVVDNCISGLRSELSELIRHEDSKLSLLTIDFDPEKPSLPCKWIQMKPIEQGEKVISTILTKRFPGMPQDDIHRIEEYAQGFPSIAVKLQLQRLNGAENIGHLDDREITDKLIWGRQKYDDTAFKVLTACSIFEKLGFEGELEHEYELVAKSICKVDHTEFYRHVQYFIQHGIIEKRGRYIIVKPIPLAIRLAAEWYKGCHPSISKTLFNPDIIPHSMHAAICGRISKLDFLPEAKHLTFDLCGPQGPFGNAEGLLTDRGSELFRYFVEINPEVTVETLERVTSNFSREDFLGLASNVRRNLVWALEKLCFWSVTFHPASHIMLELAAAENESWSNNATNQLCQLFHIHLSGTQAPLAARLEFAKEALYIDDTYKQAVIVKALGTGLEAQYFNRMLGVECQGSKAPQSDYSPQSPQEVIEYWEGCLSLLTNIITKGDNPELARAAKSQIATQLRGLICNDFVNILEAHLLLIAHSQHSFWPSAIEAINHSLKYDIKDTQSELYERVSSWKILFVPTSVSQRLQMTVSRPSWDDWTNHSDGTHIDTAATNAQELAQELSQQPQELLNHIHLVLVDEQRKGYFFGTALGEFYPDRDELVSTILEQLQSIPPAQRNLSVLGGILDFFKPKDLPWVKNIINTIVSQDSIVSILPNIIHMIGADAESLQLLLDLEAKNKISTDSLYILSFGHSIVDLTIDELSHFCLSLALRNTKGAWIALQLAHRYCHGNEERWMACASLLTTILLTDNLMFDTIAMGAMGGFTWQNTISKLSKIDLLEESTALTVFNRIFDFGDNYSFLDIDSEVKAVVDILLARNYQVIWPLIGDRLLHSEGITRWRFNHLFGFRSGRENRSGFLELIPIDYLVQWCQKNPGGSEAIARIMPLFSYDKETDSYNWRPLPLEIIKNFGESAEVGKQLYMNLSTGSFDGRLSKENRRQMHALIDLEKVVTPKTRLWIRKQISYLESKIRQNELEEAEEGF